MVFISVLDSFFVYTDNNGYAQTIYESGMQDTIVEEEIQIIIQAQVQYFPELSENETITINFEGSINAEFQVEYFDFFEGLVDNNNITNYSHILGEESYIATIAKSQDGVGVGGVPVRFYIISKQYTCEADGGVYLDAD